MSLEINVYAEKLSDELIPKIVKRLNEFDMDIEIHPNFSFETQVGFLPFKFSFKNPHLEILKNKKLISGFEIYIDNYDFEKEKKSLNPKLNFFEKILKKKKVEIEIAKPEIENRLRNCKKVINFNWSSNDTIEMRFAVLTSSIITELTDGVCHFPSSDFWYENKNIVVEAFKQIKEHESEITENRIRYHEFEKW